MSATLLALTEDQRTPKAREQRILDHIQNTGRALHEELDSYEDPSTLKRLLGEYHDALYSRYTYWERRAAQAERCLYSTLSPDLTDEQRERVLATLRVDRRRDPHLLTEHERKLIEQYRATDPVGRQLLRMMFERLAATNHRPPDVIESDAHNDAR